jgi:SAM-dependent methyltransferase
MNSGAHMGRSTEYNETDYREDFIDNRYNNWKVYRPFLSKLILHAEGRDLLDIGCGAPYFGMCCNTFGANYLGLDNSEICLAECKKSNINVMKHDLMRGLPGLGRKFDIICFHAIFEHLPLEADIKLLEDAKKYGKENTIYSFQIPTYDDSATTAHRHEVHITIKPYSFWKRLLEDHGFVIIDNYNWSFGLGYYLLKIFKGITIDPLISQMNVVCKLAGRS